MHPYATDSNEHIYVPFILAVLAITAAWLFVHGLNSLNLIVPWWIDAPSALTFYGIFYSGFDRWLWRFRIVRWLKLVKTPVFRGKWEGQISSSFDEHAEKHAVKVDITQTWTRLRINLRGKDSKSHSLVATLLTEAPDGPVMNYQYLNEPLPHAKEAMHIHYGTARLVLSEERILEGEYYSGRGRQNVGSIHLERIG